MSSNPSTQPTPYQTLLSTLLSHQHPHIFFSPPTSPHKLHIPQKSSTSTSTPTISSLSLHPVIESLLHLLNLDLPSAHFLCRHAEVSPKYESMYVHGILHRIEGDIDNARAWYGDVQGQEVFNSIWDESGKGRATNDAKDSNDEKVPQVAKEGWAVFLDRLERYRDRTKNRRRRASSLQQQDREQLKSNDSNHNADPDEVDDWTVEERLLRETSLWEILRVLRFCEGRFGTGELDVKGSKGEFLGKVESGDEKLAEVAHNMVTGGEGWREF